MRYKQALDKLRAARCSLISEEDRWLVLDANATQLGCGTTPLEAMERAFQVGTLRDDILFVNAKNRDYGGSWKKRGGIGAYMMLARKMDRIENMGGYGSSPEDELDLRCYLLLVINEIEGGPELLDYAFLSERMQGVNASCPVELYAALLENRAMDEDWNVFKVDQGILILLYKALELLAEPEINTEAVNDR